MTDVDVYTMEPRNSKERDERIRKWCFDNGIKTHTVIPESFCGAEAHDDIAKAWYLKRLLFKDGTIVHYTQGHYKGPVYCENPGLIFDLYNIYFTNQIVAAAFSCESSDDEIIEIEPVECTRAFEKDMFTDGYLLRKNGGYFGRYVSSRHNGVQSVFPFSPMHFYEYIEELKEFEDGDFERYVEKWGSHKDNQEILGKNRIIEYEGTFDSAKQCRNYIIDNREDWDGYIVRSNNNWDSDTIYRWQELSNGKIIWRKEKA